MPSRSHYIDFIDLEPFSGDRVHAKGVALLRSFPGPLPEHEKQAARAEWEGMPPRGNIAPIGEPGPYGQFVRVALTIASPGEIVSAQMATEAIEESQLGLGTDVHIFIGADMESESDSLADVRSQARAVIVNIRLQFAALG